MAVLISADLQTLTPTQTETDLAMLSSRLLSECKLGRKASTRIQILDGKAGAEPISVPTSALRFFAQLLTELARGHAVTLIPTHTELTTQQAADLLNVSRPYLAKLLDDGKIPGRLVGKYRRVRFDDLMTYKQKDDDARAKILDELTAEAQELGLGY